MHLHGFEQIVIAKDGEPLDHPYAADTVLVAPGERYTVIFNANAPGTWVWHCHILNHVESPDGMFGMVTAVIVKEASTTRREEMIFTQHYLACLSHASYLVGDETTGRAVVVDPRRTSATTWTRRRHGPDDRAGHRDAPPRRLPERPPRAGRRTGAASPTATAQRRVPGRPARRRPAALARRGHAGDPRHAGPHPGVDLRRGVRARRRRDPVRRAHRRHPVRRRRRSTRPARRHRSRAVRRGAGSASSTTRCTTGCCGCPTRRVFPAHGAGSSCGKQLSSETSSTLGEQRAQLRTAADDEDEFVAAVTEGQPLRPQYFEFDAQRNRRAAPVARRGAAAGSPSTRYSPASRRRRLARHPRAGRTSPPATCAERSTSACRVASPSGPATCCRRDATSCSSAIPDADEAKVRLAGSGTTESSVSSTTRRRRSPDPTPIEASSRLTVEQLAELLGDERRTSSSSTSAARRRRPAGPSRGPPIPLPALTDVARGLDPEPPGRRLLRQRLPLVDRRQRAPRQPVRRRLRPPRRLRRLGGAFP